ncbi:hypothetical protein R2F61_06015 [Mollicutes bacterium LVI A0078]|nr:hypothetical protein RZE84_06020 [Mollicutes bacterium LVI A0075]WOO90286.1 hypothetical protein R2F61_06015 [Mollicutes bacterium LVI A0078]
MNEKEQNKDINNGEERLKESYSLKRELKKTSFVDWIPGIIAALVLLSAMVEENAEVNRILEVESEYNTNIEDNAIDVSSFDNQSQNEDIESYQLKVGDDISPGLYSVKLTSIEHLDTFVDVEVVRNGEHLNFSNVETDDQQLVVNLNLKQYDQISFRYQASKPVQVLLILQEDYIAYNGEDFGIYTSPDLIASKKYTTDSKSYFATYEYDKYQRLIEVNYANPEQEIIIEDNQYVVIKPDIY